MPQGSEAVAHLGVQLIVAAVVLVIIFPGKGDETSKVKQVLGEIMALHHTHV